MRQPLFQHLNQLATDRWARQGVRTLLRAASFGAGIWCVGLGGHLLWGWPLRPDTLGALALAVLGAAVLLLLRPRLSPRAAARRLDRRFHLDEQLATAVEVAATKPPAGSIAARLVTQSANTARLLHQRITRRQRPPWNEALTLVALLPAALGLYILTSIDPANLDGSALPLPPLAITKDPAQEFPAQPPQARQQSRVQPAGEGPAESATGNTAVGQPGATGDPRALEALANALRDQGATRSAAEALDRDDIAGAAQRLRELADQAGQLSPAARSDLADSLRGAAEQIAPSNPSLADQLRQSADGLEQGGQAASQALDDLARALERLQTGQSASANGSQGQSNQGAPGAQGEQGEQQGNAGQGNAPGGAGNGAAGEQRQAAHSGRLGVAGQPVPLDANGPGQVPAEPSDRPPTTSEVVPGSTGGDNSSDQRVRTGDDPLRVPLDERDVVQNYFQP